MNVPQTNSVVQDSEVDVNSKTENKKNTSQYSVTHKTVFSYSEETRENVNQVRLKITEDAYQKIDFYLLTVLPATKLTEYPDFYGNTVHYFEVNPPHKQLVIESRSVVSIKSKVDYDRLPYGSDHSELENLSKNEELYEFLNDNESIVNTLILQCEPVTNASTLVHYLHGQYIIEKACAASNQHKKDSQKGVGKKRVKLKNIVFRVVKYLHLSNVW